MNPTPNQTSAFPYTNPYTNPYTQRKTAPQSSFPSSSSSQSPQRQLEHSLEILVRSNHVPPTQSIEQLFDLIHKANSHNDQSSSCWSLQMAESLASYVVRIFGWHENINMTGRNPEGYPSTLCFLARSLDQWSDDDSIMYAVTLKEFEVEVEQQQRTVQMSLLQVLHSLSVNLDDPIIQNPAIMCLSIIWRYLDRVQFLTSWKSHQSLVSSSIDSAWWMQSEDEETLAYIVLKELLK
jgi:hypothetical protein